MAEIFDGLDRSLLASARDATVVPAPASATVSEAGDSYLASQLRRAEEEATRAADRKAEADRLATEKVRQQETARVAAKSGADAKAKLAADAKAKLAADAKAKEAADAQAKIKAAPARIWVQVATGADIKALRWDWRNFRKKWPDLMNGKDAWTSSWGKTNRMVVGPFASLAKAKEFQTSFHKAGGDGFVWESTDGLDVDRLAQR